MTKKPDNLPQDPLPISDSISVKPENSWSELSDPLTGIIIERKYKLERCISNGPKQVYAAHHIEFNKKFAIKIYPTKFLQTDANNINRLRRELNTLGVIKHPNVAQILDFGITESDIVYLVMDFIEGVTLRNLLSNEKFLSPERAVYIVSQICDGLAAIHRKGILHCNLNPDNLILETANHREIPRIVGFGSARLGLVIINELDSTALPEYMSPEQFHTGTIYDSSDIYSLGIIL